MINVLVVEDDPMVAQLHEHYLGQIKGFQLCDMARSGDEALRLLQTLITRNTGRRYYYDPSPHL